MGDVRLEWLAEEVMAGLPSAEARAEVQDLLVDVLHLVADVLATRSGDEETVLAAVAELGERWATSGPSAPWRVPGEPGARVRTYVNTRVCISNPSPT
ncbi:hypothetical protein GCM10015535_68750 [Streptomyces gelaticus]|uniref:Nucleotide pyrophosphohydrolase n=1 Tax=Streptomyces gelaticus TaxID=285446 RepID=A0ABQ2W9P1_9ACTN|nr:DUF6207 family protein [Streptomyces gelaticus]GGV97418.1 hypothetical protein GCM10015535_68750 [Streptomyces gelaticus]